MCRPNGVINRLEQSTTKSGLQDQSKISKTPYPNRLKIQNIQLLHGAALGSSGSASPLLEDSFSCRCSPKSFAYLLLLFTIYISITVLFTVSSYSCFSSLQQATALLCFLKPSNWPVEKKNIGYLFHREKAGDTEDITSILDLWNERGFVKRIFLLIPGSMFLLKLDLFDKLLCPWG